MPSFAEIVERSLALLQRRGRVSHTALRLEFGLDDATFTALREELVAVLSAADDDGRVLVARDGVAPAPATAEAEPAPPAHEPQPEPDPAGRRISVLLCELAETPQLEALDADARAVVGARFHAICGEVAARLGGHVLPWVSDGVAIFFGHPRARADDAVRAARCGWEILRTLEAASEVVEREFAARLEARLAIATGTTGDGAEPFGDVPRSAGAMQEAGAPDRLTVDAATREQADAAFEFEPLGDGRFALAGPAGPYGALALHAAPPLVGRTGERALLQALAERAAGGTRAAVLVRGEAGIGKTRLLEELAAGAGAELGLKVVRCACSPYHRGSALYPLLTGLRRHDVALPDTGGEAGGLGPARRRRDAFAALADALATAASRTPLLLVVDDLHWADASTLEFLATVLDGPRDLALMLALTARSDFQGLPQRTLQRVELGRLDVHQTLALVEHVAAAGTLPDAAARLIAQHAGGSPLLAAELTRTALATQGDGAPAAATLYGCLMGRLDRDSTARAVAQLAATFGREFDRALLDAVGTIEPAALDWGLERLVAEDVIAPAGPGRFAFCHSLLQEAARSSQRKRALRNHNREIARALLTRFPHVAAAEPERIARHFEYAREMPDAVRYWRQAGREALDDHALREATLHFERAIELNARTPDSPDRRATELELRLLAGQAIAGHAGWKAPAAVAHHARAERLSDGLEPTRERFDGLLHLASHRAHDGRPADALRLALTLLPVAEAATDDPALLPAAECELGGLLVACGRHRDSLGHLARAVELSDRTRRGANADRVGRDPAALALAHRALALACRDDHEGARYAIAAATDLLRNRPHPRSETALLCTAATAAHVRGDHDDVRSLAAAALALAHAEELAHERAQALALHGWASVRAGEPETGLGELRRALADWSATGATGGGPLLHGLLAGALAHTGEPERALATVGEALRGVDGGERWYEPELHRIRAELLLRIGDVSGAHRSAGTAVALARRMRAGAWERRAAATLARLGGAAQAA